MSVVQFVKEAQIEFKRVSWPSKSQTTRLTALVLGVTVIVGLYVAGLDYVFNEIIKIVINK